MPSVSRAKGIEWPHVQPHGEDPQVAPARQEVLASPGRAKTRVGGGSEEVDWVTWPCGQNPARKPAGSADALRRARAIEPSEQSSTCRASTLQALPERTEFGRSYTYTHLGADERELDYAALLIPV